MTPVDWPRLGDHLFTRTVEALVKRRWAEIAKVTCPDGRGGDNGIDIEVVQGKARRRVYQIKYFTDGFSGDRKFTRRRQIKNSFERANTLQPQPFEWYLVVPTKLTPGERKYVLDLEDDGTARVKILDRPELDDLMAQYPDIHQYLATDQMRDDIRLFQKETETLSTTDSLSERLRGLGARADAMNLNWGVNFTRTGQIIELSPYPKTPSASHDCPITVSFGTRFGPEHADLRNQFERLMKFGAEGTVILNSETLTSLSVDGPIPFATDGTDGELEISKESLPNAVGKSAELRFLNDDDVTAATHEGTVTYANHGTHGWAITLSFYGHAAVEIDQPNKVGEVGAVHVNYNFHSIDPNQVLRLAGLLDSLHEAARCELYLDQQRAGLLDLQEVEVTNTEELRKIVGIATDLDIVQRHCSQFFTVPPEVTAWDRVNLRVARCIIEGFLVASPRAKVQTVQMTGEVSPELELLLSGGVPIRCLVDDFTLTLSDRQLPIGTVGMYHPRATAVNPEKARAAMKNGTARGRELQLKPGNEPYFYLYLADKTDSPQDLKVAMWSLPDIDQPGVDSTAVRSAVVSAR
ncbi:hypothetical protein [Gordonia sp. NPDC003950]